MQVCTSLQTDNHASTPPLSFLQAGCPSCRPTNSVKALKAQDGGKNQLWNKITSLSPCVYSSFWGISPQTRLHPQTSFAATSTIFWICN